MKQETPTLKLNDLQKDVIKAIRAGHKMIGIRGGWGCGKTSALVFALIFVAKWRPNCASLIITDTHQRWRQVLSPEIKKWCKGWHYNGSLHTWTDPTTNHIIWCKSYFRPNTQQAHKNPLEGLNISGACFIDECQVFNTPEVAHKALGRLRSGVNPLMILVGLPIVSDWWIKLVDEAGGHTIQATSFANQSNLSQSWFETAKKTLPPDEYEAMIMNKPRPPKGLIYSEFDESLNVVKDFQYDQSMTARVAIDWGFRKPSALIIVHCPIHKADIIVHEINPSEVTIKDLSRLILEVACPRKFNDGQGKILLDGGCADKSGRARSDLTGSTAFRELARHPNEGGIGLALRSTTDPFKTNVLNGIQRLKRAFHKCEYKVCSDFWERSKNTSGNSLRKAIYAYGWSANQDTPNKSGVEDPLDALRYDCIFYHWHDTDVTLPKRLGSNYSEKRKTTRKKQRMF